GCAYGSGRTSAAYTMLNIAVFAPMPSANVRTLTAVNPGFFRSMRTAKRSSSVISASAALRRNTERIRTTRSLNISALLRRLQHLGHRRRELSPRVFFRLELLPPAGGQFVV